MQEMTLTLSLAEINQILTGLGELQYKQSYALINKIQQQAEQQITPTANEN